MKTLKCDLCDHEEKGETFEEWMNALKPHYGETHAEVMKGHADLTEEERKKEMEKWIADNKARFDAT